MKRIMLLILVTMTMAFFSGCDAIDDLLSQFEETEEAFAELSDLTGGQQISAKDAEDLPKKMIEILGQATKDKVGPEVVFLIDKTGSMKDDIDSVKEDLSAILAVLPANTHVAFATYGDKNEDGDTWFSTTELTTDHDLIQAEIDKVVAEGGGDIPESVYDALYEVMDRLEWGSNSLRMILLIGDAPPLTGDLTTYSLDDVVEKSKATTPPINVFTIAIEEL